MKTAFLPNAATLASCTRTRYKLHWKRLEPHRFAAVVVVTSP